LLKTAVSVAKGNVRYAKTLKNKRFVGTPTLVWSVPANEWILRLDFKESLMIGFALLVQIDGVRKGKLLSI
jgi:hypothetical protein